ncbi:MULTISPECIES: aminotransferase class I/II-fold pyridoxal phosphate-dependent enzyme [Chromobacteriaceae]|uniref:Aminotransferase class I/II-fold pyridoxal phosphate-dependent enzyme n=3 Tax=Chromobacteriaceae TaxID=1499392 RepID=A0ABV0H1Z7_9NEIS|nr:MULTISPECIES: aminotransferase class I/II-fold pyridoxal phosphate-dependent enzyme [Chromobacteriaceae]ERE03393.1 ornithine decarboxylase [Pseudogulbenkiania ferrooxidans EGD-HP2]MBX9349762.1 aminotransferase class I/II-fold pyridoxal phosphate-dependent enzyme [Chromobacterium vaccinii]MCD4503945.1 aminotransferase class I/II-fold pyridoxal phosphate-dependent enzyme [Chromobacterium piscinae]NHQ83522.1 aminotransferase class I/II-fold pyridoxal phosphate-dependent enzyme [Chromobacterium 
MKPVSRVVVVSDDVTWQAEVLAGLGAAAVRLENPFGLTFVPACTTAETMDLIARDGEVQVVLVDRQLKGTANGEAAAQLANRISDFRPEISLYVFLQDDDERALVEELASHAVDGYFYRDEADFNGWFRILVAELAEKSATPFYDKLKQYVRMAKDSWHTPGHSGGDSLKGSNWVGDFHDFVGEHLLRADLSVSVPMLDSLLHPTGVIAEAQMLAAKAFGARKTYFATNGTSTSNKVIFQTLLAPGDKLLLDRNCHKSVHHGVILSGARPVYLDSSINRQYGIFGPVPKTTIYQAIDDNPDARVLILTSCTYDGLRYDLKPIIEAAHEKGIKVIVDEAWYGFARFHPAFRPTALESGADYVTQSTHKVLSAFSQASMIHVNDPRFDEHLFRENFNMHASTSPQYSLIASLDVARKQAVTEGYRLLDRTLKLAQELREKINSTGAFRVLELDDLLPPEVREDGILLDPTKLTVDFSRSGFTADELQQALFERYNIQVEKSTFSTITLLLTIGTTRSKLSRLYDAMLRLAKEGRPPRALGRMPEIPHFSRLACLPRDAFYEAGERLPLLDDDGRPNPALSGRVCCDQIVPYPPGIPVLVPGQVVDDTILAYLARLQKTQKSIEMHGLAEDGGEFYLRVLKPQELAELPGRSLFN